MKISSHRSFSKSLYKYLTNDVGACIKALSQYAYILVTHHSFFGSSQFAVGANTVDMRV
jgi:hypothetical protein